jgi:dTDP-4-amino-4,6-dideoxygalactose transaminase
LYKIEFTKHNINDEDIRLANEVMNSIFITTGPMVDNFEKKLSNYLGVSEAIGLTSCTGALHLALLRFGIGPGDEVITTPLTFVATVTAILQAGAIPTLVDVSSKNGLIDPKVAAAAINPRTKAILPVHLYGRMADMVGFTHVAQKYHLTLIEDAAHCIEGLRDGIRPGQWSHAACFSFYATKNITCGEGGALVCRSAEDGAWYRSARHHGISKNASSRYSQKYRHWEMDMMGWKYNMDDIQAALLINQIDRIEENRRKRQSLEKLYREVLNDIDGLGFMETLPEDEISAHHLFTVLVPKQVSRDEVMEKMQKAGIGCAVNYRAVHTLKFFREKYGYQPEDFPIANEIGDRTISLPLYPKLSEDEVEIVCKIFKESIDSLLS